MLTSGVIALGASGISGIVSAVQDFSDFNAGNDPHQERDFGSCCWGLHRVLWKIDYYDKALEYGSPDAADPTVTTRVLTIMLASEY